MCAGIDFVFPFVKGLRPGSAAEMLAPYVFDVSFVYTCRRLIDLSLLCIYMPAIDRSLCIEYTCRRLIDLERLIAGTAYEPACA